MGDLYRHNRVDLSLQLLLELVCCFFVDLCGENAVSGFSKTLDGSYVLLLRGSILWLVTQDKSVILPPLEHFTEDLCRHCIDDLSLQFLLELVCCFIADQCDGSVASGNSNACDGCCSFLLHRAKWLVMYDQPDVFFYSENFPEDLYRSAIDGLYL